MTENLNERLNKYQEQKAVLEGLLSSSESEEEKVELTGLLKDVEEGIVLILDLLKAQDFATSKIDSTSAGIEQQSEPKITGKSSDSLVSIPLSKDSLNVGSLCEGKYQGEWYTATITNIRKAEDLGSLGGMTFYVLRYFGFSNTEIPVLDKYVRPYQKKFLEVKPWVGERCQAIYEEDGLWYPCKIKAIEDKSTKSSLTSALVVFDKYGNEQWTVELKLHFQMNPKEERQKKQQKRTESSEKKKAAADEKQKSWQSFLSEKGHQKSSIIDVLDRQKRLRDLGASDEVQPPTKQYKN